MREVAPTRRQIRSWRSKMKRGISREAPLPQAIVVLWRHQKEDEDEGEGKGEEKAFWDSVSDFLVAVVIIVVDTITIESLVAVTIMVVVVVVLVAWV